MGQDENSKIENRFTSEDLNEPWNDLSSQSRAWQILRNLDFCSDRNLKKEYVNFLGDKRNVGLFYSIFKNSLEEIVCVSELIL